MIEILGSPGKEKTKKINLLDFPNLKENGFSDALRDCLDIGKTQKIEMNYESKWGKQVWMKTIISPLKKDGSIIGAQIIGEDISDRKKTEEKQKLLLENMEDHVWYLKDPETYGKANQVHADFLDLDKEEIEDMNLYEVTRTEEEAEICIEGNKEVFDKKETIKTEEWIQNEKGEKRLLSITKTPKIENGEVQYVVCSGRDITERKEKEKKLKKSEKKFRKFFNNLGNAIIITKINKENNGEIIEANDEAVKQTGYSKDELLDMNIIDDLALERPKNDSFEEIRKKLKEGKSLDFTQKKEKKDGTEYWTDVVATPIEYKGENVCLSVIRDITEKKKTEEKEEFLHSLLRHDLRNNIQIAQGYQELLEDTELSEKQKNKLEKSKNSIKESLELIKKVKELREIEKAEKEIKEIDLTKVLKKVIEEKRKIGREEGIEINYEFNEEKIDVLGGSLLKELFSNVIGNCIQHSNGSKIFISLKKEDKHIKTIIKDNGKGLSKKIQEKIFKRGFHTEESPGSGLGMHLVKRITELYNGEIKIRNSELGGARFDIHLQKP